MFLKLFKIFSFILVLHSSSYGAYLYSNINKCIDSYYFKNYAFYYVLSDSNLTINATASKNIVIKPGFVYDSLTLKCSPSPIPQKLGIQYHEYKFLMALMGLLIGFSWLISFLQIFSRNK